MAEYSGLVRSFEPCATLWIVPALPLLAACGCGFIALRRGTDGGRLERALSIGAIVGAIGSFVAAVFHGVWLFSLPNEQRALLDHVALIARIGSFDASIAFYLDPRAALTSTAIGAAGALGAVHAMLSPAARPRLAQRLGLISFVMGALLVVTLADDLVLASIGCHALGLSSLFVIVRSPVGRASFAIGRFGDVLLLIGGGLAFWTLGGGWPESLRYTPALGARLVAVRRSTEAQTTPRGERVSPALLTMAGLPGSVVELAGAELCEIDRDGRPGGVGVPDRPCARAARPPFARIPVTPVLQQARFRTGEGTYDLVVDRLHLEPGVETLITVGGPTLAFREIRDQLLLHDETGRFVVASALPLRRIGGVAALTVACLLIVTGVGARFVPVAFQLSSEAARAPPAPSVVSAVAAAGLLGAVVLLARIDFLLDLAPNVGAVAALLGAIAAIVCAARAAYARDLYQIAALLGSAQLGLALAALGVAAYVPAALFITVAMLATAALLMAAETATSAVDTPPDAPPPDLGSLAGLGSKWPRVSRGFSWSALAFAAAPVPALGVFWAREDLAWSALSGDASDPLPGSVVCLLSLLASSLIAFSSWRAHYVLRSGKPAVRMHKTARASGGRAAWLITVSSALALGVGLGGLSPAPFAGEQGPSPLASALAPLTKEPVAIAGPGPSVRLVLAVLGFALAVVGFWLARRRYGATHNERWQHTERSAVGFRFFGPDTTTRFSSRFGSALDGFGARVASFDAALYGFKTPRPAAGAATATQTASVAGSSASTSRKSKPQAQKP